MKKLRGFNVFDTDAFFKDKDIRVVGHEVWAEYQDGKKVKELGTKYKCIIAFDKTKYEGEDVQPNLNGGEAFNVKVPHEEKEYKPFSRITLLDASASVYGTFGNELSVKAEDIEVIQSK